MDSPKLELRALPRFAGLQRVAFAAFRCLCRQLAPIQRAAYCHWLAAHASCGDKRRGGACGSPINHRKRPVLDAGTNRKPTQSWGAALGQIPRATMRCPLRRAFDSPPDAACGLGKRAQPARTADSGQSTDTPAYTAQNAGLERLAGIAMRYVRRVVRRWTGFAATFRVRKSGLDRPKALHTVGACPSTRAGNDRR